MFQLLVIGILHMKNWQKLVTFNIRCCSLVIMIVVTTTSVGDDGTVGGIYNIWENYALFQCAQLICC